MVVQPFHNLLCAGEETNAKYIGSRVLDAGDIIQTLSGWTVIGYGTSRIPLLRSLFRPSNFRKKSSETQRGSHAMNNAIGELSLKCNPSDAKRALYLLSGPPEEMNVGVINEIGNSLKRIATEAVIRSGDYPRGKHSVDVTLVLSELDNVRRVIEYFTRAIQYISSRKKRWDGLDYEHRGIEEAFRDIPSLL